MYLVIISKTKSITNASNKNKIKIFFSIISDDGVRSEKNSVSHTLWIEFVTVNCKYINLQTVQICMEDTDGEQTKCTAF